MLARQAQPVMIGIFSRRQIRMGTFNEVTPVTI